MSIWRSKGAASASELHVLPELPVCENAPLTVVALDSVEAPVTFNTPRECRFPPSTRLPTVSSCPMSRDLATARPPSVSSEAEVVPLARVTELRWRRKRPPDLATRKLPPEMMSPAD